MLHETDLTRLSLSNLEERSCHRYEQRLDIVFTSGQSLHRFFMFSGREILVVWFVYSEWSTMVDALH